MFGASSRWRSKIVRKIKRGFIQNYYIEFNLCAGEAALGVEWLRDCGMCAAGGGLPLHALHVAPSGGGGDCTPDASPLHALTLPCLISNHG